MVASHRTRDGGEWFIVETRELEGAKGWHYTHGGRKGRGCCILHGGDNPAAMEADFDTGRIRCYTHGCWGRIAEHPDTRAGAATDQRPARPPTARNAPPERPPALPPDPRAMQGLQASLAAAQSRLPGSPGEAYIRERGFALAIAQAHGLGWGVDKAMRGRVVFPLSRPDGVATSATGRAIDPDRLPKYWTLPAATYPKGWFNGAGVALARERGWPLYLAEGPFDALALIAGGIPTAVAVLGVKGIRTDWLAGVPLLVACLDNDAAGQAARAEVTFTANAAGVAVELLPADALGDSKDLGEYWQLHGALPPQLVAHFADAQAAAYAAALATPTPALPADPLPDERTRAAGEAARLSVVSFAHLAQDLADALSTDDPAVPYWRAVLLEAEALRRNDPRFPWGTVDRCPTCGTELLPAGRCRTCHRWERPDAVKGVSLALYFDDLDDPLPATTPTISNML